MNVYFAGSYVFQIDDKKIKNVQCKMEKKHKPSYTATIIVIIIIVNLIRRPLQVLTHKIVKT